MNEYTQEPSFASKFSTKQTNITYVFVILISFKSMTMVMYMNKKHT